MATLQGHQETDTTGQRVYLVSASGADLNGKTVAIVWDNPAIIAPTTTYTDSSGNHISTDQSGTSVPVTSAGSVIGWIFAIKSDVAPGDFGYRLVDVTGGASTTTLQSGTATITGGTAPMTPDIGGLLGIALGLGVIGIAAIALSSKGVRI
jgi:hypothetical protein